MKKTCFLLTKLMTLYTSKAKSCRPIQIFACNIPHSGIIDLTAKYLKEKIKLAPKYTIQPFPTKTTLPVPSCNPLSHSY